MNKEIPTVSTKSAILGDGGTCVAASRDGVFIVDFAMDSQMFSINFTGHRSQSSVMTTVIRWKDVQLLDHTICMLGVDPVLIFWNFEVKLNSHYK